MKVIRWIQVWWITCGWSFEKNENVLGVYWQSGRIVEKNK